MKVDKINSIIELTEAEKAWFLNLPGEVPSAALEGDAGFVYRSFRDKVEHLAREAYHSSNLTVMIYAEGADDEIAVCHEDGLVITA